MSVQEDVERINRAQEVAESRIRDTMLDRADKVLDRLVGKAAMNQLSDREAAVGIFVICELRTEAAKAHRIMQQGIQAGESLTKEQK